MDLENRLPFDDKSSSQLLYPPITSHQSSKGTTTSTRGSYSFSNFIDLAEDDFTSIGRPYRSNLSPVDTSRYTDQFGPGLRGTDLYPTQPLQKLDYPPQYQHECPIIEKYHRQFVKEMLQFDPAEYKAIFSDGLYRIPSGKISGSILHVLHWPPSHPEGKKFCNLLDADYSPTIRFMKSLFPNIHEHLVTDRWAKVEDMYEYVEGTKVRRDIEKMYLQDTHLQFHDRFTDRLINECEAGTIIIWGAPNRRLCQALFGKVDGFTDHQGRTKKFIFVPHPEYIMRFLSKDEVDGVADKLLQSFHEDEINCEFLVRLFTKAPEESREPPSPNRDTCGLTDLISIHDAYARVDVSVPGLIKKTFRYKGMCNTRNLANPNGRLKCDRFQIDGTKCPYASNEWYLFRAHTKTVHGVTLDAPPRLNSNMECIMKNPDGEIQCEYLHLDGSKCTYGTDSEKDYRMHVRLRHKISITGPYTRGINEHGQRIEDVIKPGRAGQHACNESLKDGRTCPYKSDNLRNWQQHMYDVHRMGKEERYQKYPNIETKPDVIRLQIGTREKGSHRKGHFACAEILVDGNACKYRSSKLNLWIAHMLGQHRMGKLARFDKYPQFESKPHYKVELTGKKSKTTAQKM